MCTEPLYITITPRNAFALSRASGREKNPANFILKITLTNSTQRVLRSPGQQLRHTVLRKDRKIDLRILFHRWVKVNQLTFQDFEYYLYCSVLEKFMAFPMDLLLLG